MNLEKVLRQYRVKCARIEILTLEIKNLYEEIKLLTGLNITDEEIIESMNFRKNLSGMPQGNEQTDKTYNIAMNYKNKKQKLETSEYKNIEKIERKIKDKQIERKTLLKETQPIKIALDGLTEKEKLVVKEKYINNNTWYTVGEKYKREFGTYISERTCKNIRDGAFKKIEKIIGV